jgi:hypothetical protein
MSRSVLARCIALLIWILLHTIFETGTGFAVSPNPVVADADCMAPSKDIPVASRPTQYDGRAPFCESLALGFNSPDGKRPRLLAGERRAEGSIGSSIGAISIRVSLLKLSQVTSGGKAEDNALSDEEGEVIDRRSSHILGGNRDQIGGRRIVHSDSDCGYSQEDIGAQGSLFLITSNINLSPREDRRSASRHERQGQHEQRKPIVGIAALIASTLLIGRGVWHGAILVQDDRPALHYCLGLAFVIVGWVALWFVLAEVAM